MDLNLSEEIEEPSRTNESERVKTSVFSIQLL